MHGSTRATNCLVASIATDLFLEQDYGRVAAVELAMKLPLIFSLFLTCASQCGRGTNTDEADPGDGNGPVDASPSSNTPGTAATGGSSAAGAAGAPAAESPTTSAGAPVAGDTGTSSYPESAGAGPADTGTPLGDGPRVIVTSPMDEPVEDSCGIQSFDLEAKPAEILLLMDRSASMKDPPEGADIDTPKWELTTLAVTQVIEETDAVLSWGLKLFPHEDADACTAETTADDIDVPVAAMNAANVVAAFEATDTEGDGTPTAEAVLAATAYLKELALTSNAKKSILLATDGQPSCVGQNDTRPRALDAVAAALATGFPTFVVGVNTTNDSATETLNEMAVAGGYPRDAAGSDPEQAILYYLANTQPELTDALRTIAGLAASCVFNLDPPPPAPENIAVDFNGMRTPRDPDRKEGWDYTSDDYSTVEVFGSYCELIQNEAQNRVEFLFGCPGEPIPLPT